jgi:hypothetical protein
VAALQQAAITTTRFQSLHHPSFTILLEDEIDVQSLRHPLLKLMLMLVVVLLPLLIG